MMSLQTMVGDVKDRVEAIGEHGQEVAKISFEVLKQANTIVIENFQALVKDQTAVAKELFESARSGFEKARADGLRAVVTDPVAYLPSTEKLIDALNGTVSHFTKTGDELVKTVKTGFEQVQSQISGKPVVVRKAAANAKSAARHVKKTAAGAKRQVKSAAA